MNRPGDAPDPFDVDLERLRRRRTVKWSLYGGDVLAAWVAEMDFDVAAPIRRALHDAVDRDDLGYVEADLSGLTGACARFLDAAHGWPVAPTRIFPIADVLSGIALALETFGDTSAPVVVPTPAYPPFFEIVALSGRRAVPVPMVIEPAGDGDADRSGLDDRGRWVLDLDRVDAALAGGATAVLLCNPHNPTGRAFERGELNALAEIVERRGARVVADEVHAPLVLGGGRHVPYASVSDTAADHSITVTSASKTYNLAGLKCAQVVATNHADASRWRRLPLFAVPGPTPLGIAASIAAYAEGTDWRRELLERLDANRRLIGALLDEHLPEVRYRMPEATFLAWLDCTDLGLEDPAGHFLDRGRVAVSDGPAFGAGHEQFVRLNFATSPELLAQIVERMAASG